MTKRDYVTFARMIRTRRHVIKEASKSDMDIIDENITDAHTLELDCIVYELANIFESENPQFNREKFVAACQLPKEKES